MTATNTTVEVTALVVRGVSGSSDHRLVIINNHTFAAGDIADVITEQGRIRVHCVEIKPHSVVIEIRGQYHELPLPTTYETLHPNCSKKRHAKDIKKWLGIC